MSSFSFSNVSNVYMRRSKFPLDHGVKTTMSVGRLQPIDIIEVYPGDSFRCKEGHVLQLSSAYLRPVLDNLFLDMYYFFVPSRLLYDDWEKVFGDPKPSSYRQSNFKEAPSSTSVQTVSELSIAQFLGLPLGKVPKGIDVLPFRAFAQIYNEWFRNENVVNEVHVQTGEFSNIEILNGNPWSETNYTGLCPKIPKKNDYFTSCLPSPQKGEVINFGLSVIPETDLLVRTGKDVPYSSVNFDNSLRYQSSSPNGLGNTLPHYLCYQPLSASTSEQSGLGVATSASFTPSGPLMYSTPTNLHATFPEMAFQASSVNDLRVAFALQKMLEQDARTGTRYREYILGHFGVSNADARMQIPEFLGGRRTPLNTYQVAQTSPPNTGKNSLASLGAFGRGDGGSRFTKSFTEHGYVFCIGALRQFHTYQQGIQKFWFRHKREDFYDPKFANLGEMPVYNAELFVPQTVTDEQSIQDLGVFGYNEAWADLRYKPSIVTGQLATGATETLDIYHFADYYGQSPTLTADFVNETAQFFDRTIAVPSTSQDNFVADFYFKIDAYRVMPVRSVPGLIDHH